MWETSSGYEWRIAGDKDNQSQYKGQVKKKFILFGEESPNGQGKLTFRNGKWDGDKYVGEFKDGLRTGKGTYIWSNGDKYVGEWRYDNRDGTGTITTFDGNKYVGEWKNNKHHGQGTTIYGRGEWEGDKYVGGWKDGLRSGQGTYIWSNGDKYVGEWKDG